MRDALLGALDVRERRLAHAGRQAKLELGYAVWRCAAALVPVAGRTSTHIAYDAKDDSIILLPAIRVHCKSGRDKRVKWILAPSEGWNKQLASKIAETGRRHGKPLTCDETASVRTPFDSCNIRHGFPARR